jgi:hypothetical protein
MKKKKVCFFTIVSDDEANQRYLKMVANSLKKYHPDIPHIIKPFDNLHNFRIYALHGKELAKEYELVINIDNDSIVTGSLDHIINDDSYDLGGVLNNNLIDPRLQMWDTPNEFYINAGFIAVRGQRIWNWWDKLNHSIHWEKYKFREQDMLNIIFHYGDLRTKIFDHSDNWHGLIHKGQWKHFVMRGDEMILPKTEGVCDKDKTIKVIHWAGGQVPKMNYWVHFPKPVAERIDWLVKEQK